MSFKVFITVSLLQLLWIGESYSWYSSSNQDSYGKSTSSSDVICDVTSSLLESSDPITSMDISYDETREQFAYYYGTNDERNERISPDIIVKPQTESNIQDIIQFARECGYAIAIRSGGHQYSGLSSCNEELGLCLQVLMDNFNSYVINNEDLNDPTKITSISIGSGMTLGQLSQLNVDNDIFVPAGVCSTVGVGGHFQSSAAGNSKRSFGLGLDYVKSFRIILSDGSIKDVTYNGRHKDLYWAVIGGNPGSWGIITEYTINVLHDSDYPYSYRFMFGYMYSKELYSQFTKTLLNLNENPFYTNYRDFSSYLVVGPTSVGNIILLYGTWTGIDNGNIFDNTTHDGYQLFVEQFKAFNPLPALGSFETVMPMSQVHLATTCDIPIPPNRYYIQSDWTEEPLNETWVDLIIDQFDAIITHPQLSIIHQLNVGGGQMGVSNDRNSFPWRNMRSGVDNWILFPDDSTADLAEEMLNDLRESTINYWENAGNNGMKFFYATDGDEMDINELWPMYYPNFKHYRRLQKIKKRVDPINLFRNSFTVPLPKRRQRYQSY